jgi:hypothetical protein
MRKRWCKIVVWGVVVLLVLPAALLVSERVRGRISLARFKHQLSEKGEKLTPRDMMLPPSEGENGAPEAIALAGQLLKGAAIPDNPPPAMARALEGEMVFQSVTFDSLRKSNTQAAQLLFGIQDILGNDDPTLQAWERWLRDVPGGGAILDFVNKEMYCRLWRFAWLDQAQRVRDRA